MPSRALAAAWRTYAGMHHVFICLSKGTCWCVPNQLSGLFLINWLQGVPAMALSLADHGARKQEDYHTPAALAVPIIQVMSNCVTDWAIE